MVDHFIHEKQVDFMFHREFGEIGVRETFENLRFFVCWM